MADGSLTDLDPPRRLRRGPAPRLYVIARQSPVPWLRVRRLGAADRPRLSAHLLGLAAAAGCAMPEAARVTSLCDTLDLGAVILFGAIAGNTLIAAACGVPTDAGTELVTTEDATYTRYGLGGMLARQVLGARPAALQAPREQTAGEQTAGEQIAGEQAAAFLALMRDLGGRSPRPWEPEAPPA